MGTIRDEEPEAAESSSRFQRPTCKYVAAVATVTMGASFQWYNMTVTNTTQHVLMRWINETYNERNNKANLSFINVTRVKNATEENVIHIRELPLSDSELLLYFSMMTSALCVGAMIGCFFMPRLVHRFGVRNGLMVNGLINVIAGCLVAAAYLLGAPELLIVSRTVYGFCLGVACGLVPIYLVEISPPQIRGAAVTVIQIVAVSSEWVSLIVGMKLGNDTNWPWVYALPAVPALIMAVVLRWMPESSTNHVLANSKLDGSEQSSADRSAQAIVASEMVAKVTCDEPAAAGMLDVLKNRAVRKPLTICLVAATYQMCPQSVILAYSTDILVSAGFELEDAQMTSIVMVVAAFFTYFTTGYLIERLGRRPICLTQMIGSCCFLTVLSISIFIHHEYDLQWARIVSAISMVAFTCMYAFGAAVPWLLPSEMFTQRYRASVGALGALVNWMTSWFVTSIYLSMKHYLTTEGSFVPFLIVSLFCISYMYKNMPETKNRTAEELMNEYVVILEK